MKIKFPLYILLFSITLKAFSQKTEVFSDEIIIDFSRKIMEINWIVPRMDTINVAENSFIVNFELKTHNEVNIINFFINGSPDNSAYESVRNINETNNEYHLNCKKEIKFKEGINEIIIAVKDAKENKQIFQRNIFIILKNSIKDLVRNDYALIFATNLYSEWNSLENPIPDAQTISDELSNNYGYKVELLKNPTQQDIMLKIKEYAKKSFNQLDQLFIFFAGHGQFDESYGQGYIVCADSKKNDEAKTTYIPHSVLRNAIDNIPVQHILLVMDVCYGGTFDPVITRSDSRGDDEIYKEQSPVAYLNRKLKFKTRKFITSGAKEYVSDGIPGRHSPFARKFIEALRSYGGTDEFLTLPELYEWLDKIIPIPKAGSFGTDEPGSNYIFIAGKND